jgi:diacylglycerol kinase family enzyme
MGSGAPPGVLINARAGWVRRNLAFCRELRQRLPDGHTQLTGATDEIGPALQALRACKIQALVLVGGDGTLTTSLTELVRVWPSAEWPAVVVTRGGTINTLARALGARSDPAESLEQLLAGGAASETRRALLRVRADAARERCGMIFGLGAAARWLEVYYAAPPQGVLDAVQWVARSLGSAIVNGRLARRIFEPVEGQLALDEQAAQPLRLTVLGAATVREVGLGFRPFLSAGDQPDRFHLLHSDAPGVRYLLELPAARLGIAMPGTCMRHHTPRSADLRLAREQRWMIDAELQPPARRLELSLTPPLCFWGF